jgi:pyrroline-5-carboxylate reductase
MTKLAFMGAGNMAQAIIGGLVENGFNPADIWAADPVESQLMALNSTGINTTADNLVAVSNADVVIISVKPDVVEPLAREIAMLTDGKLFISVAAGTTTASLSLWLEAQDVIRCMPNTPSLVQRGMTGLFAATCVNEAQRQSADTILSSIGKTLWFDEESHLDAVTAISGSGPAYFFYIIEVMQLAAEAEGLSRQDGRQLVLQTALGAAEMALQSSDSAGLLRQKVTSPGGTTAAALAILESSGLQSTFAEAISAARKRSEELSGR